MIEDATSSRLRRQALRDPQITLDKLKELGQALEQAEQQADKMEAMSGSTESSMSVFSKYNSKKKKKRTIQWKNRVQKVLGLWWQLATPRIKTSCPVWEVKRNSCQKLHHFAKHCRSKATK